MSPAKRMPGRRDWPENLKETRPGYFGFYNPKTKKYVSLGRIPLEDAIQQVREVNLLFAKQRDSDSLLNRLEQAEDTFGAWLDEYFQILVRDRDLAPETLKAYVSLAKRPRAAWNDIELAALETKHVAELLNEVRTAGKVTAATQLRKLLKDVFKVAEANGRIERGKNPVELTYNPPVVITRARLKLETFNAIYQEAAAFDPWVQNAMMLALVTGQRRDEIVTSTFKRSAGGKMWLEGDAVFVDQGKTGMKLKIPTSIRLNCINTTIRDVIGKCRDHVVSKYLIHHIRPAGSAIAGDRIHAVTISRMFAEARDRTGLTWHGKTPPSFHEIRSLTERLHREQGDVNVQSLLGHKSAATTALYDDERGSEFKLVTIK